MGETEYLFEISLGRSLLGLHTGGLVVDHGFVIVFYLINDELQVQVNKVMDAIRKVAEVGLGQEVFFQRLLKYMHIMLEL